MKKLLILGLVGILTSNGYVFSMEETTNQKTASKPVNISYNSRQNLFNENKQALEYFTRFLLLNNNGIYEELLDYYNSGHSKKNIVMCFRSHCKELFSKFGNRINGGKLLFVTNQEVAEAVDELVYNIFIDIVFEDEFNLLRFVSDMLSNEGYSGKEYDLWENDEKKLASVLRERCLQAPELSSKPRVKKLLLNKKEAIKAAVDKILLREFLYAVGW